MTGPTHITLTAPCPACGNDAIWHGTRTDGDTTSYPRIDCPCEWHWTAQRDRLLARRALLDQPPVRTSVRTPDPPRRRLIPSLATLTRRRTT